MIDQSLVNHVESYILNGENLPVHVSENILDAYISLIEQNAELHKELAKSKADYNKLYEICINSGINKNIVDMNMRLGNGQT